jgi:molybdopterin-guanine dinucleotide biosynthesis protein A
MGAVGVGGGGGAGLGGADTAALELAGATLLEGARAATAAADEVVVVGDRAPTSRPVTWAREEPPGGGPAAGLLAGLGAFSRPPDLVCVLAVDMPQVTGATFERLVAAVNRDDGVDGAVLVDASGRRQALAAAYRTSALDAARPARPEHESGLSMRRLLAGLRLAEVPGVGAETRDVDTWADLRALEAQQPPEEI